MFASLIADVQAMAVIGMDDEAEEVMAPRNAKKIVQYHL